MFKQSIEHVIIEIEKDKQSVQKSIIQMEKEKQSILHEFNKSG
jgi:hypothetical protein